MNESDLLTVNEVAAMLKVVPQTVYNWCDRGELEVVRVGQRRVRIRRSALNEFLGQRESQPEPPSQGQRLAELQRQLDDLERRVERLEQA